ncbi:MAG: ABC transporter ATP-binding protein [Proteobacteria bacterium]|nr:ABC transporter ATP-binding protein [Pseudomonadota bacterium]
MTRGASLEFDRVSKTYGAVTALQPTSMTVRPGEFFALLGPSGSGKSTLLGTIAGFVAPSGGCVLVDGADITAMPPHRRNIGMVFQNYALFPYLTVAQNIAFPLKMRRLPKSEIAARVDRALEMVRLGGFGPRMPAQLSGGQQQRVALARAAVYDPPLLLMDEPLGALDKNLREEMQEELRQFHRNVGATILYVTHDQQEAASMADRIAIMNHGKAEQVGAPHEVYERPGNSFVARFLGEANMFRLRRGWPDGPGRLRCETEESLNLLACGATSAALACVRPEDIVIGPAPTGRENCFAGRVTDLVQVAGSVRYRVAVAPGCTLIVRASAERRAVVLAKDDAVHVGWDAADMRFLSE